MAKYFFDFVSAGGTLEDGKGQSFPDLIHAQREGLRILYEMASDEVIEHSLPLNISINIRSASERPVRIELALLHPDRLD